MVKIGGPKTTFVSQVRIRSELSDNHSGMTYLTFSECVHDAIPSGDLALQVNSSKQEKMNSESSNSKPSQTTTQPIVATTLWKRFIRL